MDKELECDFYLGDRVHSSIKLMNYDDLKGFKKVLPFLKIFKNFYWQKGAVNLAFKPYKTFIITGEPYCLSTWFVLILCKLLNKKSFVWTHGWYGDETFIKKFLKKIFFSLSNKILLYGNYARNLMIKEGFNSAKLVCIYNSMDYENQLKVRLKLSKTSIYINHFQNKYPVVLYIGRIQKTKKINLLIEAMHLLHTKGVYCNLIIIGEETDACNIQDIVLKYKLDKYVWFYGPCYNEIEIGELIYNASLCVSPGNVGLTAIHSLVYGTPVLTHNNFRNQGPEFETIEQGVTGDFFIENSIDDLCEKIIRWSFLAPTDREFVRNQCYRIISEKYNPYSQILTLKELLLPKV